MTGTVFDIGYRGYAGAREGKGRAQLGVFKDGVRTALGLGRGPRAKAFPWLFIALLSMIGLVMALIAGAAERLGGPGASAQLPSHGDYYGIASIIMYVFAAVVAPELLTRDRREGVMNLYLVRPITPVDYVASRWCAFLVVMLIAAWVPQAILFVGLAMGSPAPVDYLARHWVDIPRFLGAGLVMAVYLTTLALLVASFTTRRALAAIFLVGLFVIIMPFAVGLAQELPGAAGQWVSMFNLAAIPLYVNDLIFGKASEMTEHAPGLALGSTVHAAWYLGWVVIPAAILVLRYRRMAP